MASVFKSGTWLVRHLIEDLTGLAWNEPEICPGEMNYGDPSLIEFKPGYFFSWHSEPSEAVRRMLVAENAKVVMLTRNVYDLAISMYRHFANDIDNEIGRGAGQRQLFESMTRGQGLALTICGAQSPTFEWVGMGPHFRQMQSMLEFSLEYPCCVMSFEKLFSDRQGEILRLAQYLDIEMDGARLEAVCAASNFDAMKAHGQQLGLGSHFQEGKPGRHADMLDKYHVHMIRHLLRTYAPGLTGLAHQTGMPEIVSCMIE
jgi:hypothetical protein